MIVFALPYRPDAIWMAGYGVLLEALRRRTEVSFDPAWEGSDDPIDFDAPLLTTVRSIDLLPVWPHLWSTERNVAIAVPEQCFRLRKYIRNAWRHWDHIVTLSQWSRQMIEDAGWKEVSVITHGPHPYFTPGGPGPNPDRFTIFSGGKLELRKAQDIVIHAMGYLMQKHRDVYLITDWFNPWKETVKSLYQAPLMRQYDGANLHTIMRRAGIDFARTRDLKTEFVTVPDHLEDKLAAFRTSDAGLFPNRAEACPNSLMVDMMGCEKPVIALYEHGHRDVLDREDPLCCHRSTPLIVADKDGDAASWYEPDLDEVIARLEWAYQHRDQLARLGRANGARLKPFAVDETASRYLAALEV